MTASPGLSTSPHSPRTTARRRRACLVGFPPQKSSRTSKSRTGGSGCSRTASRPSQETCPSGAEGHLGDTRRAGRRSVRSEDGRHCVEVEAKLVHRGQRRSDGPTRAATLLREENGRYYL